METFLLGMWTLLFKMLLSSMAGCWLAPLSCVWHRVESLEFFIECSNFPA